MKTTIIIISAIFAVCVNMLTSIPILEAPLLLQPVQAQELPIPKPTPKQATYVIDVTSYNPETSQTDASPCIGAAGTDLCEMSKRGERTIALSQNLVGRSMVKPFHYGDLIALEGPSDACSGIFHVQDTMNARFGITSSADGRADIFRMNRAENHGLCRGVKIRKL